MKKAPKIVHGCKVDDNCWKPWREMAVDLMAHVSCDPNSLSTSFGGFDSRNTEEAGFCMDDQQSIWYAIGERDERRDSNRIVVLSRTHSKVDGTMIVALTSLKHWRLVSCSASNIAPHNPIRIYYGRPTVPVRLNLTTDWRMELDIFLGTMESRLNADDVLLKSHREDKPFVPVLSPPRLDFMSGILKRFKSRAPGVVGLKRTRKADDIVEPRMEPSIESRSTMSIRTSSRRLRQIVMIKDRCFYDEIETGGSGGRRS
ncbi:hypothetical protein M3Y94_01316200 [Aphelenchoides besseyi]|nr:hypothetical protein M3Y94_01316200 [Aphelenchoides besseyi]